MSITFRAPSSPGTASIHTSGTIALANGQGTQVSGSGNTVVYTVTIPPTPTPTPKPVAGSVNVSSSSHPDQNTWYASKDVVLAWNKPDGVTDFSYAFDTNPATIPDNSTEGADTSHTFTNSPDGTSYFHIKAKNDIGWGDTTHFKVNIDSTSPDPFCINSLKGSDGFTLYFATNDYTSGISKFTVKADDKDLGEQKSGMKVDLTVKNVIVTAFDKVGNSRDATVDLGTDKTLTAVKCESQPSPTPTLPLPTTQPVSSNPKSSNLNTFTIIFIITTIIGLIYSLTVSYLYIKKGAHKLK